jgi:amino acid adenylation domain-containing protein
MKDYCKVQEGDCILQKTPYTFDVSVWELLLSFLSGASLVFAKPEGHKDPLYLRELIQDKKVTLMHFVPSMLEVFLLPEGTTQCPSLKRVITSGEALPFTLKNRFFEFFPQTELHNLYGPTEASIDVTFWDCTRKEYEGIVPIGKPIWNTSLYILDMSLNPVPEGVAGELYLGGDGLARGYLNRPELTAERFIPNPFAHANDLKTNKKLRLYRTGDLARYLPDGNIEFLGRTDDQVKIRGFRIELGEIEAALNTHGHVVQAVVVARENEPGDKKLITYVVPQEDILSTLREETGLISATGVSFSVLQGDMITGLTEDLRDHLVHSLPDYMIPSFFIFLDKIPLTPNGKIDRKSSSGS